LVSELAILTGLRIVHYQGLAISADRQRILYPQLDSAPAKSCCRKLLTEAYLPDTTRDVASEIQSHAGPYALAVELAGAVAWLFFQRVSLHYWTRLAQL